MLTENDDGKECVISSTETRGRRIRETHYYFRGISGGRFTSSTMEDSRDREPRTPLRGNLRKSDKNIL